VDWREFQYLNVDSEEVKRQVGRFCTHIRDALHRPWPSPLDPRQQEKAAAAERTEAEDRSHVAEVKRGAEADESRLATEVLARHSREEEPRRRGAEPEQGLKTEAEPKRLYEQTPALRAEVRAEQSTGEARKKKKPEPTGSSDVITMGHYIVAAFFLINGLFFAWIPLLIWFNPPADPRIWLMSCLGAVAIAAGVGTMKAQQWARFLGVVICLAVLGLFLWTYWLGGIPFLRNMLEICIAACLGFYFFGWEPDSWLANTIPKSIALFVLAVLAFDGYVLTVGLTQGSTAETPLWLYAALVASTGGMSIYCLASFYRRFGGEMIPHDWRSRG
jgi:hypothetical protein